MSGVDKKSKWGVPNTIDAVFEDFFRGSIDNFGQQLSPRFDNADRKRKLAACRVDQLMMKFEAIATKIRIGRYLEELLSLPWSILYAKTSSTRHWRWTNDGKPNQVNLRSTNFSYSVSEN